MSFVNVSEIKPRVVVPGFSGRFFHSENITMAYWDIEAGASIPPHQHVHEMVVNVISGKLQLTLGDETRVLDAGMAAVIPSNVTHTATGVTACKVIDVFHPLRADYQST